MTDRKPSGFQVVEVLPTGDQRTVYKVRVTETGESLIANEFIVSLECGCGAFVDQNFKRRTKSAEINVWLKFIWETHKQDCPFENNEVFDGNQ